MAHPLATALSLKSERKAHKKIESKLKFEENQPSVELVQSTESLRDSYPPETRGVFYYYISNILGPKEIH